MTCEWFLNCNKESTGTTTHLTLGEVPTCDQHAEFAKQGLTAQFPPIVAVSAKRHSIDELMNDINQEIREED